ncbi:MAG: hypothetical protein H6738_20955 [Alphaproteobacteria bacterium]|nr:hypothetical protein [Alphaproteobacteria bacterium]MCB9699263.1 hypothetical protein [Alphaproteobacteria bacterium]
MRPSVRFALVAAVVAVAGITGWWIWAEPTTPQAERRTHTPPNPEDLPTVERLEAERKAAAAEGADPSAEPQTREQVLDDIQRAEEATMGAAQAERRRRTREQLLDARARRD